MENYLSENEIKTFITANILHAIDRNLLNFNIEKLKIEVKHNSEKGSYEVKIVQGREILFEKYDFDEKAPSYLDHLRSLMGITMMALDSLISNNPPARKPILKIVK